ncbi:MAG: oligosaccharide flippase family protein [Prevotella sp.]|nr:oligosaccharide flippase family protein [Prevotella sp.]
MISRYLNNKLFRNGVIFSFFSFFNSGVSFFLIIILAKYFSPAEYGYLNLFTTITTILNLLMTLNTSGYFSISFFKLEKEDLQRILSGVVLVIFSVSTFLTLLIFIFSDISVKYIGLESKYQFLALLVCFFQAFITLRLEIWRLEEKPIIYGVFSSLFSLLSFGITLLFVIYFNSGWVGRVDSFVIVTTFFSLISIIMLIRDRYTIKIKPRKKILYNALSYGLPLIPHSISTWVRQGGDRYLINYFLGINQLGYFSFAFNVYNIILILGSAFNATYSVNLFKILSENEKTGVIILRKQIKIMCMFFTIASLLIFLFVYFLIPIFFPKYEPSTQYLFPLVMAGLFQCLYLCFVNFLFFYKKTRILMYITVSISFLHFILSFALTRYGMIYTAYITMFTNFLIFLIVAIYSNKYINFKILSRKNIS